MEVVEANTTIMFKIHLDKYIDKKGLEEYGPYAGKWDELDE